MTSPHPPVIRVVTIITVKGRARAARCRPGQHPYKRPAGCHPEIPASRTAHLRAGHARGAAATMKANQGVRGPNLGRPDDRSVAQPGLSITETCPVPGRNHRHRPTQGGRHRHCCHPGGDRPHPRRDQTRPPRACQSQISADVDKGHPARAVATDARTAVRRTRWYRAPTQHPSA